MSLRERLLKSATNMIDPEWHSEGYPSEAEVLIDLILAAIAEWGEELCNEHWGFPKPARPRQRCDECWKRLRKED